MNDNTPRQYEGSCLDTTKVLSFPSEDLAIQHFEKVKQKLIDVNNWFNCAKGLAHFSLCTPDGSCKDGKPELGDLLRINVPGPDNASGDGDDWVKVEDFVEDSDHVSFRVRPCTAPISSGQEIAHFLDQRSTNTFGLRRKGTELIVEINGRNEHINMEPADIITAVRNAAVAVSGFIFGSRTQWESLADGLISNDSK